MTARPLSDQSLAELTWELSRATAEARQVGAIVAAVAEELARRIGTQKPAPAASPTERPFVCPVCGKAFPAYVPVRGHAKFGPNLRLVRHIANRVRHGDPAHKAFREGSNYKPISAP